MFDAQNLRDNVSFSLRLLSSLLRISSQQSGMPGATDRISSSLQSLREVAVGLQDDPIPTKTLSRLFGLVYLGTFDLLWDSVAGSVDRGREVLDRLDQSFVAEEWGESVLPELRKVVESVNTIYPSIPGLQKTLCSGDDIKVYDARGHQAVALRMSLLCQGTTLRVATEIRKAGVIDKQDLRYQLYISFGAAYQSAKHCCDILEQLGYIQSELQKRTVENN